MTNLKELSDNPGRLEIHKALGTYHFDKTSDQVDYEYFGRIEMPNEWWQDGLHAIIDKNAPYPVTNTNVFAHIKSQTVQDIGQLAMYNDYVGSEIPIEDAWFDRFMVEEGSVFNDINNFFHINKPVIRIADQNTCVPVPLHIDHEHAQILQSEGDQFEHSMDIKTACGSRGSAKKFLIAMHDFDPGCMIVFGNTVLPTLKQGDIISWKFGTPHCTVNFSQAHRYMMGIIGSIDRQFYIDKFDFDYEDTNAYPTPVFESV